MIIAVKWGFQNQFDQTTEFASENLPMCSRICIHKQLDETTLLTASLACISCKQTVGLRFVNRLFMMQAKKQCM